MNNMRNLLVCCLLASLSPLLSAFMVTSSVRAASGQQHRFQVRNSRQNLELCSSPSASRPEPTRQDALRVIFGGIICIPSLVQAVDFKTDDSRIRAGYATLMDLYDNWDKYAGTGEDAFGDNVRRQVGTVGNKSPLFGIRKVLLRKGVDLDLFEELDRKLTKIDADAYSAIFADSSTAPKRGYEYMKDAKQETKQAIKVYKQVMDSLGL